VERDPNAAEGDSGHAVGLTRPERTATIGFLLRGVTGDALRRLGLGGAVLSAGGYVLGYATIWLFSRGLGVAPTDLELGNREYLLIAALWALLLAAFGVGSAVVVAGNVPYSTLLLITTFQGSAALTLIVPMPPLLGLASLMAVIVFGGFLLAFLRHTVLRKPSLTLIVSWAFVAGLMGWTCEYWGQQLRENPNVATRGGPIALLLVVPPTEGRVTLDLGNLCAARLSDRVYLTEQGVVVTTEPQAFRPTTCF
jgi:hypothetical protein